MNYYTVLGYTDNYILANYSEKYFQKLLKVFSHLDMEKYQYFISLPPIDQKSFLMHPDISCLLNGDIKNHKDIFFHELEYLFSGNIDEMTGKKGIFIPSTNIRITLEDNNPSNSLIGHPDHDGDGNMLSWGSKDPREWAEVFSKAFKLLKMIDEGFYNELNTIIKKIVPMNTSIDVHNSCSYAECIGTLYLGYTINSQYPELNILEALIHESSHNKLNLIMQTSSLHENDFSLQYYSPYRPDARHIQGVLLGVHAIVPTVYVMLTGIEKGLIRDKNWLEKMALYHIKNKLGYNIIKKFLLASREGEQILDDLNQVLILCDVKIKNLGLMSQIDTEGIRQRTRKHFSEVQAKYSFLKY